MKWRTFLPILILLLLGRAGSAQTESDTIVAFLIKSINQAPASIALSESLIQTKDSIETIIRESANDSLRAAGCLMLANFYLELVRDFRKAELFFDSVLVLASPYGTGQLITDAYWGKGNIHFDMGNYVKSINAYQAAYESLEISNEPPEQRNLGQARLLVNLGALFTLINDLEEGQSYYLRSVPKQEESHDSTSLAITYFNISYVFSDMKEWEKSLEYARKSLPYATKGYYHNIVNYCRVASLCMLLNKWQEAEEMLRKAERAFQTFDPNSKYQHLVKLVYFGTWGQYHAYHKNMPLADRMFTDAYVQATLQKDPYWVAVQARDLGLFYLSRGQDAKGKRFLTTALEVAQAFNYMPQVLTIFSDLSAAEKKQGNLEGALQYRDRQISYYDSLIRRQNQNRIMLNDARFQAERKQNEIIQLTKDNEIQRLKAKQNTTITYALACIMVMLAFSGSVVYRNLKHKQHLLEQQEQLQKQKINELENEKQLLASEAVIKGQEEERGRLAKDLHDGLGGLLSGVKYTLANMKSHVVLDADHALIFERSLDMLDHSIAELRRVAHNMMPEVLVKFGLAEAVKSYCESLDQSGVFKIDFQVLGDIDRLDSQQEILLYRIVQELLNNVARHASASHVLVQLARHGQQLAITVEDNGKGFNTGQVTQSAGAGWANIRSRIDYLKGKLDVQSTPGKGTSVHITIDHV